MAEWPPFGKELLFRLQYVFFFIMSICIFGRLPLWFLGWDCGSDCASSWSSLTFNFSKKCHSKRTMDSLALSYEKVSSDLYIPSHVYNLLSPFTIADYVKASRFVFYHS